MVNLAVEIVSAFLLFSLVFGMSATVELSHMQKQVHNSTAILIGAGLQFVILPLVGFMVVKLFQLPAEVGITLLVITSSPGGSYSNWWCSMFNADLALSVTMTAMSTLLSTVMLPLNLVMYTRWTYSTAVVKSLDWMALFVSLAVVIGGIASGLTTSYWAKLRSRAVATTIDPCTTTTVIMHRRANRLGNFAGLALILLSVTVSSSDHHAALWEQDASFYTACALPPILGLAIAVTLASRFQLEKPERVAVAVESCYQQTGIATTVALTMFQTEKELATAIGVPLFYGICEAIIIFSFLIISWKINWTKAPANESLCNVIATSYEVETSIRREDEHTSIEVVLSEYNHDNLIFFQKSDEDYVIDEVTLHDIEKHKCHCNGISSSHSFTTVTEEQTDCSESLDDNHSCDGIMKETNSSKVVKLLGSPGPLRQRVRGKRYRGRVVVPSTILSIESSESSLSDHGDDEMIDSDMLESMSATTSTGSRLGRTISSLRARAVGHQPQESLASNDVDADNELEDSLQSIHRIAPSSPDNSLTPEGSSEPISSSSSKAQQVAATGRHVVVKVAVSVAHRARRQYRTVSTASPLSDNSRANTVMSSSGPQIDAVIRSDDSTDNDEFSL